MGKNDIWVDLHDDIKVDASGGIKQVVNIEAVRTSIRNILGTRPGERPMYPTFGSTLKNYVFDPADARLIDSVIDTVKRDIETWDNRVEVTGLDYNSDPDNNTIYVIVQFRIRGYDEVLQLTTQI